MIRKTIKGLPNPDWQLWSTFAEFMDYFAPVVSWGGQRYRFETGVIRPQLLACGSDLRAAADLVVDNGSSHWLPYFQNWAQSAVNSGVRFLNNGQTYRTLDKHNCYDVLSRAMHPRDRHPVTVLLPEFYPYTADQEAQMWWEREQKARAEHTRFGFDPAQRQTDDGAVQEALRGFGALQGRIRQMRGAYYPITNYLGEAVKQYFNGRFPLYLKTAYGFGGTDVYRVDSLEDLYAAYDRTEGKAFHLQEAIGEYDLFVRCMAVGPQVLPMEYRPAEPFHLRYGEQLPVIEAATAGRLRDYVLFVDSYHRWNHNSFEALTRDGRIYPIDYANACPDSSLTSLHVHFPWLICAMVRWCTFVVAADVDLRADLEQKRYSAILNSPTLCPEQRYEACAELSRDYFRAEEFAEYCDRNMSELPDAMICFYDERGGGLVERLIQDSDFPPSEHERFIGEYRAKMDAHFLPGARTRLLAGVAG